MTAPNPHKDRQQKLLRTSLNEARSVRERAQLRVTQARVELDAAQADLAAASADLAALIALTDSL